MAFCLVINDKPIFYTSELKRVVEQANMLLGNLEIKRRGKVEIVGDYDPNNPKPFGTYPILYRKCNRCLKLFSFPYFMNEKQKSSNCCLHCREKRKAQYRKTYNGYNPAFVDGYIAKTYGKEYVVDVAWNKCDMDARPIRGVYRKYAGCVEADGYRAEDTFKSPVKSRSEMKAKKTTEPVKDRVGVPDINPYNTVQTQTAVETTGETYPDSGKTEPLTRRWSYHFVLGLKQPTVRCSDWNLDFNDETRAIQHGLRAWSDYTLVCYGKVRNEADEKIKVFLAEHSDEVHSAKTTKFDFGWE